MNRGNGLNDQGNEDRNDTEYENNSFREFRKIPSGAVPIGKTKTVDVVAIVMAWLIALALVYMVLIKISILFH